MKLRKVILIFVLALIVASAVVLPVAADRPVTQFTFTVPDYAQEIIWEDIKFSGQVVHFHGIGTGTITNSTVPLLEGASLWQDETGPSHVVQGQYWDPAIAKFTITLKDDPNSGWSGTAHALPQVGDQWPRPRFEMYFQGEGFGSLKNTRIEIFRQTDWEWWEWSRDVYSGHIEGM